MEFKQGDIVWFPIRIGFKKEARFGMVNEVYHDGVDVTLFCTPNKMIINGTPIHDFIFPSKETKLPKGWTYNTQLVEIEYDRDEELCKVGMANPSNKDILSLIDKGLLIPREKEPYYYGYPEAVVDKGTYHIKWNYSETHWFKQTASCFVTYKDCFETRDDVVAFIEAEYAEQRRIASLSDHDYNIEILHGLIDKWKSIYGIDDSIAVIILNKIETMSNFDNLEFRIAHGSVEFKEWNKKKWLSVSY